MALETKRIFRFKLDTKTDQDTTLVMLKLENAGFENIKVVNNQSIGILNNENSHNLEVDARAASFKDALLVADKMRVISERKITGFIEISLRE
ncbi:MAG TPA: hypothetical protein VNF06_02135 [Candidatus Aquilonibacter sp.]|nr:hypothetical protein [Candidatus Aquilonibacter sp.]